MSANYDHLIKAFPHLSFKENEALKPYTYMKVGGPARLFLEVTQKSDLFEVVRYCFINNIPFVVLGGASNVVVSDQGIDKLVILNKTSKIQHEMIQNHGMITADSGVITAVLSNYASEQHLTGLEHFVGVPGTVGGAVFNNSHFTAHELFGNTVQSVEVCTSEGNNETWKHADLRFGYDTSIFHSNPAVILSVTLKLNVGEEAVIRDAILTAATKRALSQPIGVPSTGCMYKNPTLSTSKLAALQEILEIPETAIKKIHPDQFNVAAGLLIDQAGLKGRAVGGAMVSTKHATYIVNTGDATTTDIETLCRQVEEEVQTKFQIKLEKEVFFIR
ncbi:UDP-N-acetylmuramate dehydrogenase [Candidatus Woesebacteria bacterium]|nr:UDP-N-acetylmuramate dehydrogenase [Candidatus Woesebacteria bacterium]